MYLIKLHLSLCGYYAEMFLAAVFSLSTLYDVTIYISTSLSQGSIKLTSKQMEMLKVEKTGELLRHVKGFIIWPLYIYLPNANLWLICIDSTSHSMTKWDLKWNSFCAHFLTIHQSNQKQEHCGSHWSQKMKHWKTCTVHCCPCICRLP